MLNFEAKITDCITDAIAQGDDYAVVLADELESSGLLISLYMAGYEIYRDGTLETYMISWEVFS